MQNVELQILEGVVSLGTVVLGAAGTYLTTKAKKLVDSHLSAKNAEVAKTAIDGLTSIAHAVVQDFNQRIVSEAKTNGVFTLQLAQSIKNEAIQKVLSQGEAMFGPSIMNNAQALVSIIIEQAVANYKGFSIAQGLQTVASEDTQKETQSA